MKKIKIKRRTDIINYLMEKYNYNYYLEIGLGHPYKNFDKIKSKNKEAVDPNVKCKYQMTSDVFFEFIKKEKKYDLIFIDGLHTEKQSKKDVNNSLDHLNLNGIILLHDCNPINKQEKIGSSVWKTIASLKMEREDLFICTVNMDCGIGIVKRGNQHLLKKINKSNLTFDFFKKNRKKILNLYSVDRFLREF